MKTNAPVPIRLYRDYFIKELLAVTTETEAESFFYMILEAKQNLKKIDIALNPNMVFSQAQYDTFECFLLKLKQHTPIQYILKEAHFYGLVFKVSPAVLIPRPETEELISWILSDIENNNNSNINVIDIGTGSGCIAISIAKNTKKAAVTALDISTEALIVAQENAITNQVSIDFITQDILQTKQLNKQYDVIVSNPPYVRQLEKKEIKQNVLNFEPHLALFVTDDDALVFYKKIAQLAKNSLTKNGFLYFEINQYLGLETILMLNDLGFQNVQLKQDIYGNNRMIRCSL